MCYIVDCKTCGKQSWGGCGKHLAGLYARIEQGKHCMCRSWPGVVIPSQSQTQTQTQTQIAPIACDQATARPSGNISSGAMVAAAIFVAAGLALAVTVKTI